MGLCIVKVTGETLEFAKGTIGREGRVVAVYEDIQSDCYFVKCDLPQVAQVAEGCVIPFVSIAINSRHEIENVEEVQQHFAVVAKVEG